MSILAAVEKFIQLKLHVTHKTKDIENKISKTFAQISKRVLPVDLVWFLVLWFT